MILRIKQEVVLSIFIIDMEPECLISVALRQADNDVMSCLPQDYTAGSVVVVKRAL